MREEIIPSIAAPPATSGGGYNGFLPSQELQKQNKAHSRIFVGGG